MYFHSFSADGGMSQWSAKVFYKTDPIYYLSRINFEQSDPCSVFTL